MVCENSPRRRFLKLAGASAAMVSIAGCQGSDENGSESSNGGDDGGGNGGTDGEPETHDEFLQAASALAHEEAPWLFLNRQFSVFGQSSDIKWEAPRNEVFDAYTISPQTQAAEDVVFTQPSMDSGLDPQDHASNFTNTITDIAYDRLYTRTSRGEIQPELATEFERIEEDRVKFTLREDVQFHNGDQLTPEDAVFSIKRIIDDDVGDLTSPQSGQLENVVDAEVSDDHNAIEVVTDGFNPVVLDQFATYCEVVQRSWIEENDSAYINQNMNGTGPFNLSNYEEGVRVEYERFDDYWGEAAEVATLEINASSEDSTRVSRLLSNESTVVANVPPGDVSRIQENDGTEVSVAPSSRILFGAMRDDVEPFDSTAFRQAMNYAIDLDSIIENVLLTFGAPTGQPSAEGYTGYTPNVDPYPYDPERAQELVDESGYTDVEIKLHVPVGRYLKGLDVCRAATAQISELDGVTAEVEQREISSLFDQLFTGNRSDKPPWYLLGWGNPMFNSSQWFIPLLTSDGFASTWANSEFDRLVEEAMRAPTGDEA